MAGGALYGWLVWGGLLWYLLLFGLRFSRQSRGLPFVLVKGAWCLFSFSDGGRVCVCLVGFLIGRLCGVLLPQGTHIATSCVFKIAVDCVDC